MTLLILEWLNRLEYLFLIGVIAGTFLAVNLKTPALVLFFQFLLF